jgi:predicted acetyltransferase
MAWLSEPVVGVRESFLAAMREFAAEGRGAPTDRTMVGDEIRDHAATWSSPDGFAGYVRQLRGQAAEDAPRPEWFVPCTTLWWVEGTDYLGRIAVRHRLTDRLLEVGGHIGYDVRPTARRRGHATAMLAAALPVAAGLGIESALVTCDSDNVGSRRVIEANGGVLEDERGGNLRFWVPAPAAARRSG